MSVEEKFSVIIQTGFAIFLLGLLIATVGIIIVLIMEYRTHKLERKAKKAKYTYENDPRTQVRRQKEVEAYNNQLYFDRIQEFYNGL